MKIKNPFSILSKQERPYHIAVWVGGLILINIPEWHITLGAFHSDDFSLVIPSIYGTFLNAYLFYESARQLIKAHFTNLTDAIVASLLTLLVVTLLEALLDVAFYALYFWSLKQETFTEILLNEMLMDFIFVYLPSMMYAFIKAWHPRETEPEPEPTVIIETPERSFEVNTRLLTHVEHNGTFALYHANKNYLVYQSMEEAKNGLPDHFVQCHDSYLINADLVRTITKDQIVVGGFMLPYDEKYKEELKMTLDPDVPWKDE